MAPKRKYSVSWKFAKPLHKIPLTVSEENLGTTNAATELTVWKEYPILFNIFVGKCH